MKLVAVAVVAVAALAIGCGDDLPLDRSPDLSLHDEIFASPSDHGVLCSGNGDDGAYGWMSVDRAIDRAADEGRIVQIFMHDVGARIQRTSIEAVLAHARARGVRFVTYHELGQGTTAGPGLALAFDDWYLSSWMEVRDLFATYGARVTFFIALYPSFSADDKARVRQLADDGHDIEYHGTYHLDAVGYLADHTMDEYLTGEIDPGLAAMQADGYAPTVFAYPAGLRNDALDAALLQRFKAVRATTRQCPHLNE